MPKGRITRTRKPREITARQLDYSVTYSPGTATCSDEIEPCEGIIGQQRAIDAIRVGLAVHSRGYNIFVTGMPGTGRTTTISHLLKQLERDDPHLMDACYVNNFKKVDNPLALTFPAGDGKRFKKDIEYLIHSVRKVVPKIFMSEDYKDRQNRVVREYENRQKELIGAFEAKLNEAGFVMVQIQGQVGVRNEIQPLIDGEPVSIEKIERLAKEGKFAEARLDELRRAWDSLRREFDITTIESKKISAKLEDALEKLNLSMVAPLVSDKVNLLKRRYPGTKVVGYLEEVEQALLSDLDRFRETRPRRGEEEPPAFRKQEPFEEFAVNLILDNSETDGVPIIIEKSPTYKNLFGSLERVVDRFGYWRTDFTRIFGGSLLKASGGYLVMNATDMFTEPGVWTFLKRAIRNGELEISAYDPFSMMAGSGIKPETIPLDVKVVLIGDAYIYNILWEYDDDFKKIFKIKAEFDTVMPLDRANMKNYYGFISRLVRDENLLPYDISGMQAVVEYGRRLAGHRNKLSVRFTPVADIIREGSYFGKQRRASMVSRRDVFDAIVNRRRRLNLVEDKVQELYDNEVLLVSTTGRAVGQINGLAVYSTGEYPFGRPTRITVNTSLGKAGIINIEREADLSGPLHTKGVAILAGYFRQMFAQDKPLAMSASISFEQSYSGVDGDSASATEVFAILSSLTGLPIKQGIAVTGSVNQKGEIQPIGGVNEKIEGFYDVCKSRRLTGTQGVIIPQQNVQDLLLRPDVIESVKAGKFHIYPIRTVDEGIAILTGVSGGKRLARGGFTRGSVMYKADDKLRQMALELDRFGRSISNDKKNNRGKRSTGGANDD
ncbi:MAG: AAA family ATPase [Candidatus Zixiibacteriota bacterium]